ncbi:MAG TPA: hypothetical protein VMU77_03855 [Acidimicrobiales bacterium]|nr:hypothetical protein [Acidimicrobiales bacterium]
MESVERGQAGLEQTVRTIESLNPRAEAAGRKEIQAKEELDEAIGISSEAAIRADEADSFYLFRRAELDSRLLFGRYESYVESSTAESRANRFLAECKITDRDLPAIEQADLALLKARSALDVARPSVEFEALDSVAVQINGVMRTLARGERDSLPIAQNNELIVDSRLALRITSGVAVEQLESELENQVRRVGSLASQFALDPIDPIGDARRQLVRRAVELQALQSARNAKSQALQDFSLIEELVGKLDQARNLVETFLAGRDPGLPDPPELEDAEIYRRDAFQARDQASRNLDSKRVFFEAMREERQEATREIGELKSVTRDAELRLHEDLKRLDASRQLVSDEQLAQLCAIAEQGHLAAVTKLDEANQKLSTFQPDELELRRQNAKAVDKRHRDEEKVLIARQSELRGSLSSLGDQDLQDAANAAEGELEVVRTAHAKMERDAGAAQLLFETFERHREKLRLAYVEPYSEEIHRLARIVFGTQTQIEIDPSNLSIVARTKDGVTVPYASLSTGAREQLGIIARLACARLVGRKVDSPAGESTQGTPKNDGEYGASDIGVPLIFDDALGHSDHERLGSLGVVLDSVGRQVQVIVLTADRARFDKVGNATFVSLN